MKKRLPLFLVFVASFGILLTNFYQQNIFVSNLPEIEPIQLDYSWEIHHSQSWQINKASPAEKQVQVEAKVFNYDNQHKASFFEAPLIIEQLPNEITFVSSQKGSTLDEAEIELKENVKVEKIDLTEMQNNTLTTEQIQYNTETKKASSRVYTKLSQPGMEISGVGFKADLEQEKFIFESNVKTLYQPQ